MMWFLKLKQLFCRHRETYYKIIPAAVNCEGLEIRCGKCDKVLENKGLDCP